MGLPNKMLFGKKNYTYVLIGIAMILIGFMLMNVGPSENPLENYDEDKIYGVRATIIAPIVILAGFGMQVIAIFAKSPEMNETNS